MFICDKLLFIFHKVVIVDETHLSQSELMRLLSVKLDHLSQYEPMKHLNVKCDY
jgi:hypothetical protein